MTLFHALFLLTQLHLLRNVSGLYVVPLAVLYVLLLLTVAMQGARFRHFSELIWLYVAFSVAAGYVVLVSWLSLPREEAIAGSARFLFTFPLAILAAYFCQSDLAVKRTLNLFIVVAVLGTLTIPLQHVIGPISWFPDSSYRGGFVRYASLFGNITACGVVGGMGLVAALILRNPPVFRLLSILAILAGMVLCLQKAAVVNILLAGGVYVGLARPHWVGRIRSLLFHLPLLLGITVALAFVIGQRGEMMDTMLRSTLGVTLFQDAVRTNHTFILDSLADRLWLHPLSIVEDFGWWPCLRGIGFAGMGSAIGVEGRMAHNSLADLLFLGGIPFLLTFLGLSLFFITNLRAATRTARHAGNAARLNLLHTVAGISVVFLVNVPTSSGMLFHPNTSAVMWVAVGWLCAIHEPSHVLRRVDARRLSMSRRVASRFSTSPATRGVSPA